MTGHVDDCRSLACRTVHLTTYRARTCAEARYAWIVTLVAALDGLAIMVLLHWMNAGGPFSWAATTALYFWTFIVWIRYGRPNEPPIADSAAVTR